MLLEDNLKNKDEPKNDDNFKMMQNYLLQILATICPPEVSV